VRSTDHAAEAAIARGAARGRCRDRGEPGPALAVDQQPIADLVVDIARVAPLDPAADHEAHADDADDVLAERAAARRDQRVGQWIEITGRCVRRELRRQLDLGGRPVIVGAPRDRRGLRNRLVEVLARGTARRLGQPCGRRLVGRRGRGRARGRIAAALLIACATALLIAALLIAALLIAATATLLLLLIASTTALLTAALIAPAAALIAPAAARLIAALPIASTAALTSDLRLAACLIRGLRLATGLLRVLRLAARCCAVARWLIAAGLLSARSTALRLTATVVASAALPLASTALRISSAALIASTALIASAAALLLTAGVPAVSAWSGLCTGSVGRGGCTLG